MRLFLIFLGAAFLLAALAPRPGSTVAAPSPLLFADPWLLRTLSGFGRTVVADYLWLQSNRIDETALGDAVDAATLERTAKTQAVLDPHFTVPVLYSATYLASIPKEPSLAVDLLRFAQCLGPDRFDLLMTEAMIRVTHDLPESADRLVELAGRIEPLPEKSKLLGAIKADDWILEVLAYVRTQEGRADLIEADLRHLLKQTTHPARRERILRELETIQPRPAWPQSASTPL